MRIAPVVLPPRLPRRFDLIHRRVCLSQNIRRPDGAVVNQADHADGDTGLGLAVDGGGELIDESDDSAAELEAGAGVVFGHDDEEFIAAGAEGHVLFADGGLDDLADVAEQAVASGVAEGVVDLLEIVHVQGEHGHGLLVGLGLLEELGELLVEQALVVQAGERIAISLRLPTGELALEMIGAVADALADLGIEAGLGFLLAAEIVKDVLDKAGQRRDGAVDLLERFDGRLGIAGFLGQTQQLARGAHPTLFMAGAEAPGEADGADAQRNLHEHPGGVGSVTDQSLAAKKGDQADAGEDGNHFEQFGQYGNDASLRRGRQPRDIFRCDRFRHRRCSYPSRYRV